MIIIVNSEQIIEYCWINKQLVWIYSKYMHELHLIINDTTLHNCYPNVEFNIHYVFFISKRLFKWT